MAARSIYLIGFSGSGKSTIAQLIGEQLAWPVYDLDRIIAERSGMSIPLIFEREGEESFRERETEALRALAAIGPCIVATGGGAAVREENRRLNERTPTQSAQCLTRDIPLSEFARSKTNASLCTRSRIGRCIPTA